MKTGDRFTTKHGPLVLTFEVMGVHDGIGVCEVVETHVDESTATDFLDELEFYELMQAYRHSMPHEHHDAYRAVQAFVREKMGEQGG